jgi:hypothetical protein
VAEFWVETLIAQETMATMGGRLIIAVSNVLITDLAPGDANIDVKYNNFGNNENIYMESAGKIEFMITTSTASVITGGYRYTVTRNLDGSGANQWYAGDSIVNTQNGFIDLYSLRGVKAGTEIGPTIAGNFRNSSTYNDWKTYWAIGNLNGLYGYNTNIFGVAFGKYAAGLAYITIDATNGYRAYGATNNVRIQLSNDGSGFLANSNILWDVSGNLSVVGNALIGGFAIGADYIRDAANSFGLASTVTGGDDVRFWAGAAFASRATAPFRLTESGALIATSATISGAITATSGTITGSFAVNGGALSAGAGKVLLDDTGISVLAGTTKSSERSYKLITTGEFPVQELGSFYGIDDGTGGFVAYLAATNTSRSSNWIVLRAKGTTSGVQFETQTNVGSFKDTFTINAGANYQLFDAITNAMTDMQIFRHESSGTPAASFGTAIRFDLKSSTTQDRNAARIGALWTTATDASRTSAVVIQTVTSAGALTEVARFTNGQLGLGTTTPTYQFHVHGGDTAAPIAIFSSTNTLYGTQFVLDSSGAGGREYRFFSTGSTNPLGGGKTGIYDATAGAYRLIMDASGFVGIGMTPTVQFELSGSVGQKASGTTWSNPSDKRIKKDIRDYTEGLSSLLKIRPRMFHFNGALAHTQFESINDPYHVSVISQELEVALPNSGMISSYEGVLKGKKTSLLRFDAHNLTFMQINAIKELNQKIIDLQSEVASLHKLRN